MHDSNRESQQTRLPRKFPPWIRKRLPSNPQIGVTRRILDRYCLNTVCGSAQCPNIGECFAKGTATFMILGNVCTRSCRFCAVPKGEPTPLDMTEPERLALAAKEMGLAHVVVTSVTRDDMEDGGAEHFANVIRALRRHNPQATLEVLVPDFMGCVESVQKVVDAGPDVFNHNIETVPSLYPKVRPEANYERSLTVLRLVKTRKPSMLTKSGLMVGLGERHEEVEEVMRELRRAGCDILTIGQYLSPSANHLPVVEFVEPHQFEHYRRLGESMGFKAVASGPFVRSSYDAAKVREEAECH